MSFINPNFRSVQKKEIKGETNEIETLDVNFNSVKLAGEPRRQDIPSKEENIISLDSIIKSEEESKYEYMNSPTVAILRSVPKIEQLSIDEIGKIQIGYINKIGNTMSM